MASQYLLSFIFLITHNMLLNCASASVHSHSIDNAEREDDGSYRARDADHYDDSGHNSEFDHEAILGSVKEAEEYDRLSPEESKQRLSLLLPKMDLNGDENIDRIELKKWILKSFKNLSLEEAEERMSEADTNHDGVVTWKEYLRDSFGVDDEEEFQDDEDDTGTLVKEEKNMWSVADANNDFVLDKIEFEMFMNPEEHEAMHRFLVERSLRDKDANKDGLIDLEEFLADRGSKQDKEWYLSEKDKFKFSYDVNKDGVLDEKEIKAWIIPDNDEIADEEVEHMFSMADDDRDAMLSFQEVLRHHDVFVGSEADDWTSRERFDDEL